MANNIKANTALNIRKIMIDKNIKNESDFADLLSISKQTLFNWKKRNTYDIDKIIEVFPDINRVWLLTGEGSMLKEDNQEKTDTSINQRVIEAIDWLKNNGKIANSTDFANKLEKNRSYISEIVNKKRPVTGKFIQDIINQFQELSPAWLLTGEGSMLKGKDQEQKNNNGNIKYYYEMSATAYDLEISDNISEIEEPYHYLTIPGFRGECVAMNVAGNSMYPTAKNKDIVVVDANEVRNIIDGSVYMIIINDGHRMIKRLALDRESNLIKCISDNPDKELYPIFTIESNRIAKIYKVKGFITLTLF